MLARLVQLKIDADIHTSALPQYLAAAYLQGDRHAELLRGALPGVRRLAVALREVRRRGRDRVGATGALS